jgi:serine O-acetyltransferase
MLSSLPLVHKLGWLMDLENVEEFRNLFYYRVGVPASLWGQLLLFFSMKLFRPRDSLRINTPSIGPGLLIRHGVGCVLQAKSIGENCLMAHEVVIASKDESDNLPVIGNYVSMSAGCKILGPVTVGDYSIIGANAVVTKDVPPRSIAVGVPARIVSMDRDKKK